MPRREEERALRNKDDPYYCVHCKRYLAPAVWADHEHNPSRRPGWLRSLRRLLGLR
ncbi:MAG: hypothetical protein HYX97_06390 [Chloroflexi bacterium]|nr:hypothetical protein [Chloroflexota bacterium]